MQRLFAAWLLEGRAAARKDWEADSAFDLGERKTARPEESHDLCLTLEGLGLSLHLPTLATAHCRNALI